MINGGAEERQVFDFLSRELRDLAWAIQERRRGDEKPGELLDLYLEMIEAFRDRLQQQRRAVDAHAGRPIEPMTHYAVAIVEGKVI